MSPSALASAPAAAIGLSATFWMVELTVFCSVSVDASLALCVCCSSLTCCPLAPPPAIIRLRRKRVICLCVCLLGVLGARGLSALQLIMNPPPIHPPSPC